MHEFSNPGDGGDDQGESLHISVDLTHILFYVFTLLVPVKVRIVLSL